MYLFSVLKRYILFWNFISFYSFLLKALLSIPLYLLDNNLLEFQNDMKEGGGDLLLEEEAKLKFVLKPEMEVRS